MMEIKQKNNTSRQGEKKERTGGTCAHALSFTASGEARGCLGAGKVAAAGRNLMSTDAGRGAHWC